MDSPTNYSNATLEPNASVFIHPKASVSNQIEQLCDP